MSSFFFFIQIAIIIAILFTFVKLLIWFLYPYIIDRNDPLPILKPYQFIDPSIKTHTATTNFPTINDNPSKSISLIFPAYNEENRIRAGLDPTIKYLIERENESKNNKNIKPFSWEIIIVNDGSNDKTCDIVQNEYVMKYTTDKIRLLSYTKNQGKGYAVQQGMLHARGCLVLFADADGASEVTHLKRLENAILDTLNVKTIWDCYNLDGMAIGSRAHLQAQAEAERTIFRNFLMWGFHFVVKYIGNVHGIKDTQCGFKLFTRSAVQKTFMFQRIRRWCFDPELLMLAQIQNIPILEVQIKWQEIDGSKIEPMTASFNMFREILLVRMCCMFGIWYKDVFNK
eukprot:64740_1